MTTDVKETIEKLKYVRSLLGAMDNLNREELNARQNFKKPQKVVGAPIPQKPSKKHGRGWYIAWLLVAFVVLTLFSAWMGQESARAYNPDNAFLFVLPMAAAETALMVAVVGAAIFVFHKIKDSETEKAQKRQMQAHEVSLARSRDIEAYNMRVRAEIEDLHKRKKLISGEYDTSVCPWFPREYCYMDAVNYFIRELELGTATTLPEAIKNYREHLFQERVIGALGEMNDRLRIVINNQDVMIRKQEELIRQQMFGNAIACATWDEVKKDRITNNYIYY